MDKEEFKTFVEEKYKDDPEGFGVFLTLLFESLLVNKIEKEGFHE